MIGPWSSAPNSMSESKLACVCIQWFTATRCASKLEFHPPMVESRPRGTTVTRKIGTPVPFAPCPASVIGCVPEMTVAAVALPVMSLVPSKKMTQRRPARSRTSRPIRVNAGGPLPPLTMRLPAMPSLATAGARLPNLACSRAASTSGQRLYWSGWITPPASCVLQRPSVIESPNVTIVPDAVPESTSTTATQYTGKLPALSGTAVKPAPEVLAVSRSNRCGSASALLQPRQRGGHCAGALQALLRHPADHLGPARGQDAQPPAHGEPHQPAVQLDADLLVL